MSYIEAAMHRALLRAGKSNDLTTRAGAAAVLRELFDNERVYLKELPERKSVKRPKSVTPAP